MSSNFRKFQNLVDDVYQKTTKEEVKRINMFLFTDSSVMEIAFFKGSAL